MTYSHMRKSLSINKAVKRIGKLNGKYNSKGADISV